MDDGLIKKAIKKLEKDIAEIEGRIPKMEHEAEFYKLTGDWVRNWDVWKSSMLLDNNPVDCLRYNKDKLKEKKAKLNKLTKKPKQEKVEYRKERERKKDEIIILLPFLIWAIVGTAVFIWGCIIFESPFWLLYFIDGMLHDSGIFVNTGLWILCAPSWIILLIAGLYILLSVGKYYEDHFVYTR